ncbi:hypothetical protein BO91_01700 [Candidatus Synechococcus spongiarum LMB bulk10E]|uniref:Uncharacterized protein n=3 Tax=Candidatus Synechococcus spongiarum TaxID=431041 RepID=A0A1T1D0A4_9SYNE|nr:MAG: hypothetical protein TQ37_06525 [Candidatus Synechococcus spongiarum 15L]OOV34210.1 hypothetical protein BV61_03190 [Candidatus Synechococcus spongiarum LMB bulk15M]OOV34300.1 hypothetical protein BO91_01700 [Candidatus Synechococcus spongiarum LMB bulk10E]OOV35543.1 hypothetical protein BV53_03720 [Candidatus Synechococcus spongiarum LMB bulk15N]OOV36058.1 hypothetical protein BO98_02125 [Candidatus Synechococcus spongiarum LMB bulk10D]
MFFVRRLLEHVARKPVRHNQQCQNTIGELSQWSNPPEEAWSYVTMNPDLRSADQRLHRR